MRQPSVVILGLGRGSGLACARRFAEDGWSVTIVDGNHKSLANAQHDLGKLANYLHEDQTTRLGLKNALSGTLEQFDGIDAVLHIPPLPEDSRLEDMDMAQFAKDLEHTALSAMMAGQIFGTEMIREIKEHEANTEKPPYPKSFLQILTMSAALGDPGSPAKYVTQASVLSVMKALALELAPYGIRSNAVVSARPVNEAADGWVKQRTPLGRTAKAREIANTAIFASSAEAGFMTGHSFVLDGGRSLLNGLFRDPDS